MSSDISRADALIQRLETALTAALPSNWRIQDAESAVSKALGVVVYYEQGGFSNEVSGTRMPDAWVGVHFTLTLTAPQTDPVKGTREVTSALLELLPALDDLDDLFWGPTAEKVRLESGETAYRIPTTFLSTYAPEE